MLKREADLPTGWVYVDTDRSDLGGYVAHTKRAVVRHLALPPGTFPRGTVIWRERSLARPPE